MIEAMTAQKPQVKKQPVPKLVEVTVTAEHITGATRKDSGHCAASEATNATIPGARCETDLTTMTLTLRDIGLRITYLTPPIVQQMLVDFDDGKPIAPFRFGLRRVDAVKVRASRPRNPVTGKQPSNAVPGATTTGVGSRRKVVKTGATRVALTGSKPPPVGVLANRKGRSRVYGLRQLETQRHASGREPQSE